MIGRITCRAGHEFACDPAEGLNVLRIPLPDRAHRGAHALMPYCPECQVTVPPRALCDCGPGQVCSQCSKFIAVQAQSMRSASEALAPMEQRLSPDLRAEIMERLLEERYR